MPLILFDALFTAICDICRGEDSKKETMNNFSTVKKFKGCCYFGFEVGNWKNVTKLTGLLYRKSLIFHWKESL